MRFINLPSTVIAFLLAALVSACSVPEKLPVDIKEVALRSDKPHVWLQVRFFGEAQQGKIAFELSNRPFHPEKDQNGNFRRFQSARIMLVFGVPTASIRCQAFSDHKGRLKIGDQFALDEFRCFSKGSPALSFRCHSPQTCPGLECVGWLMVGLNLEFVFRAGGKLGDYKSWCASSEQQVARVWFSGVRVG